MYILVMIWLNYQFETKIFATIKLFEHTPWMIGLKPEMRKGIYSKPYQTSKKELFIK